METILSAETFHPRDKFDYWHSMACKKIVGHDRHPEDRVSFVAEIGVASLGSLDLVKFSNSMLSPSLVFKRPSTGHHCLWVLREARPGE